MVRWFLASIATTVSVLTASAGFTVTTVPSNGPIGNSPSFGNYAVNAANGLKTNGTATGVSNSTTYYAPSTTYYAGALMNSLVTTGGGVNNLFNGNINTNPGELGNALYFGVHVTTTGTDSFNLNGVNLNITQNNQLSPNPPTQNIGANSNGLNTPYLLGRLASESASTPLHQISSATVPLSELVYSGFGFSLTDYFGPTYDPNNGIYRNASDLQMLFQDPATAKGPFTGVYGVTALAGGPTTAGTVTTGFGTVDVNSAPAPAALAIFGIGLAGIVARRRKA